MDEGVAWQAMAWSDSDDGEYGTGEEGTQTDYRWIPTEKNAPVTYHIATLELVAPSEDEDMGAGGGTLAELTAGTVVPFQNAMYLMEIRNNVPPEWSVQDLALTNFNVQFTADLTPPGPQEPCVTMSQAEGLFKCVREVLHALYGRTEEVQKWCNYLNGKIQAGNEESRRWGSYTVTQLQKLNSNDEVLKGELVRQGGVDQRLTEVLQSIQQTQTNLRLEMQKVQLASQSSSSQSSANPELVQWSCGVNAKLEELDGRSVTLRKG